MLENWLEPIHGNLLEKIALADNRLGKNLLIYQKKVPSLKGIQAALVGIGDADADAVREQLYPLSFPFESLQIADLGNLRKDDPSFVIPVLADLLKGGIVPIVIGRDPALIWTQYQAQLAVQHSINLTLVDERIAYQTDAGMDEPTYLTRIIDESKELPIHLNILACQYHFIEPQLFKNMTRRDVDLLRLGALRKELADAEPLIRDADLFTFNLSALKQTEAPGIKSPTPNGLFAEEGCQLARYAGMSDKLTAAGFYGFQNDLDQREQTAQVVAQLIWYFLDGMHQRKQDFPVSTDGLTEYIVTLKEQKWPLTFWKSQKSGRWWLQVSIPMPNKLERHRLIPCSYKDYVQACNNDLSDRLYNAIHRFEKLKD